MTPTEQADAAASAAARAFRDYSRRTGRERAQFLCAIAAQIEALGPALIETVQRETALPEARVIGERALAQRCALRGVAKRALVTVASDEPKVGAALLAVDAPTFLDTPALTEEIFGPTSLAVLCDSPADYARCAEHLPGQLTATVWAEREELGSQADLLWALEQKAGRLVFNGFPTGVEVGSAMMHGGPFPATSDSRFSSVGTRSIQRFVRPIAYQDEIPLSFHHA